jgi:hypothetical protein
LGRLPVSYPAMIATRLCTTSAFGASWKADLFGARRRAALAAGADAQAAEADHLAIRIRPRLSSPATRKLTLDGNKGNTYAAMIVTPDESP